MRWDNWTFCNEVSCTSSVCKYLPSLNTSSAARQWLQSSKDDSYRMLAMRNLLRLERSGGDISRLSTDAVIRLTAELLVDRRLHIHCTFEAFDTGSSAGGSTTTEPDDSATPFPIAERRERSAAQPIAADDADTFPPGAIQSLQAAVLVSAAQSGASFCALCEAAKLAAAAGVQ